LPEGTVEAEIPGDACLFFAYTHFGQNRFYLFIRDPVILQKNIPEEPVLPAVYVILYLFCECLLDLSKGHIFAINGDAPEAMQFQARV
jgi:hypothetical protein